MAKQVEVTRESVAEQLRKKTIDDVLQWMLKQVSDESLFSDQITALEKQRDSGKVTGEAKRKLEDSIDALYEADALSFEPYYKIFAQAVADVAGKQVPLTVGAASAKSSSGTGTRMKKGEVEAAAREAIEYLEKHPGSFAVDISKHIKTDFNQAIRNKIEKMGRKIVNEKGEGAAKKWSLK